MILLFWNLKLSKSKKIKGVLTYYIITAGGGGSLKCMHDYEGGGGVA